MAKCDYLECGRIHNTHGCHGWVKVESYCDSPEVLASLPCVYRRLADAYHPMRILETGRKQETVLMPKNLRHRHDEAAKEIRRLQEREKREKIRAEKEAAAKRLEDWHRKYDFSLDGYFIRAADDRDEIIQEGRALEHCVGGYAERHMAGTTTILFLRREETPEASLYTIEMNGNTLKQIHGFRNERDGQQSPKKSMAWMLEPWIKWLKKGSPREKDGSPKLPKFATKTLQEVKTA